MEINAKITILGSKTNGRVARHSHPTQQYVDYSTAGKLPLRRMMKKVIELWRWQSQHRNINK